MRSVVELAQAGDAAVDPVFLRLVRGQLDGQNVVGGVTSGGKSPAPGAGLVHGTDVNALVQESCALSRLQPDYGQRVEENFRNRLTDNHVLPIPARSLEEKPTDVRPILRLPLHVSFLLTDLKEMQHYDIHNCS
ncbi:hypothetical protein PO909_017497 [Leuciscus waleckii]